MSKILLLLESKENLRLLAEMLASRYEVILDAHEEDALTKYFDLCILDGRALDRLWEKVQTRKKDSVHAFLPFLLVTPRPDVGKATRYLWKMVDELIISPIEKIELIARVEGLLRTRRLSLEFNRSIVQNSPMGIVVLDREGKVQLWSPACERILGWKEEEVLGHPYPSFSVGSEDQFKAAQKKVLSGETILNYETRQQRKDGSLIDIGFSAAPLRDAEGTINRGINILTDITNHKLAEAKIQRQIKYLTALRTIDASITSGYDIDQTLVIILEQIITQLNVDAADILMFDSLEGAWKYAAGRGFRSSETQYTHLRPGEGFAGRAAAERRVVHIPDLSREDGVLANAIAQSNERFITYFGVPLLAKGKVVGVLELFHRSPLNPDEEWLTFLNTLAGQAAIAIDNRELFQQLETTNKELIEAYETTIEGWSNALDLRDKETEGHSQRVKELTLRMARAAGFREDEMIHIKRGALLHDIGKMGVPDTILLKADKLTEDEWCIMRRHPQLAYDLLSKIKYLQPALDIPYCHHEKWDGSGYPRGLKGDQIPLIARIFAVVDVWDALRSDRPYRPAWSEEKALEYIRFEAGKHFDPQVVKLFFHVVMEKTKEH